MVMDKAMAAAMEGAMVTVGYAPHRDLDPTPVGDCE